MKKIPFTVALLEKLRKNSHLAKHSHFTAAKRSKRSHILIGVPIILINLMLGSVFSYQLINETDIPEYGKLFITLTALIGACLSAIQTFFNFQKNHESHRALANRYLVVARECERLIASYQDNIIDLKEVDDQIKSINKDYTKINIDAEAFPTNDRDYQRSLEIQNSKPDDNPQL